MGLRREALGVRHALGGNKETLTCGEMWALGNKLFLWCQTVPAGAGWQAVGSWQGGCDHRDCVSDPDTSGKRTG
jgi:hypothetical protein